MTQKWNLQDIKPSESRKSRVISEVDTTKEVVYENQSVERPTTRQVDTNGFTGYDKKRKRRIYRSALLIALLLVGAVVIYGWLTGGVKLTVQPHSYNPTVNAVIEAKRAPQAGELAYEVMTLEATGERQVEASGQEEVVKQAEGTILVYNAFSPDPIRLITNTRFQTEDGLVFKIKDPAIVPGYTTRDGEVVPGVVRAGVFADQPGDAYNIGPSRFSIPGFLGTPEYEKIYGESVESMSGGFEGPQFIIAESELASAQQSLRTELRETLSSRVESERPAGFIVFDEATTFTYESLPATESGNNMATIKEKVILRIPIFGEADFAAFIAESTVADYNQEPVRVEDSSALTFAYEDPSTVSANISSVDNISFRLTGNPRIIRTYDAEALKQDLLGQSRSSLPQVLGQYPAISKADAVIRPVWKTSFPDTADKIEIIEIFDN